MTRGILILTLLAACAHADKLFPVDESAADPGFLAFRVRLLAALERKDVKALESVLDPKIRVSFGADGGIAGFRRYWKLERPAQSKVWRELGTVLRLGATRDEEDFIAPYVFTRFPPTLDAYTNAAVIRPAAILRKSPAAASPKVAVLEYELVEMTGEKRQGWVQVRTGDGTTGWIRETDIRSPISYRAFFEKKGGQWKLTAFMNGD